MACVIFVCARLEDQISVQTTSIPKGLLGSQSDLPVAGRPDCQRSPILSLRGPARAVAISQNCFDFQMIFGEFETACMRLPRRFAPRNDMRGSFLTRSATCRWQVAVVTPLPSAKSLCPCQKRGFAALP